MSSCESERTNSHRQASWSSSSYGFSDSMPSSGSRDYSTGGSSHSAGSDSNSRMSLDLESCAHHDAVLPELTQVPWTEGDILSTLQKGRFRAYCGNISIECLQRLSYLLQRPLIRIAREAQRLAEMFNNCSKHVVRSACKLVLSQQIFSESDKLASQCSLLYSMSPANTNSSKSNLCSLALSVGKHHRWLVEALPAGYVHELAAVYLTAAMEAIIEETAHLALFQDSMGKSYLWPLKIDNTRVHFLEWHRFDIRSN